MHASPFKRAKKPLKSDMNVVPYIDVMLVLLVIFMVTAPVITSGLTVDLPDAPSDAIAVAQQMPAIVTVKADGSFYVRLREGQDQKLYLEDLITQLLNEQKQNPQLTVLVNGDANVAYGVIVKLMGGLQKSGLRQVGLLTESAPDVEVNSSIIEP